MSCNRRCLNYLHPFVVCLATDADRVWSLASSLLARHVTLAPHLIWSHHHGLFVCFYVPFLLVSCVTCQHAVPFLLGATCRLRDAGDAELQGGLPQGATTVGDCPRTMMDGDTCQITCPPTHFANRPLVCANGQLAMPACLPKLKSIAKKVALAQRAIKGMQPQQSSTKAVASNKGGVSVITSQSSGLVGVGGGGGSVVSAGTLRSRATSRSPSPVTSTRQVRSTSPTERKRAVSPTLSPVASVKSLTTATVGNKKV